jgi:hypothetical protein
MNTNLTIQQREEVAKLLQAFETVTPAHEEMAIRLVLQKAKEANEPTVWVERRNKCANGHLRVHLFQLEIDGEGDYIRNKRGHIHANATCDVCDGDFYTYIKLTEKEI